MYFLNNKFYYLFLLFLTQVSCQNHGKLEFIADLPSSLKENSGIESYDGTTVWIIEDNGNKDELYQVNFKGELVKSFEVKNAKNTDWEDLAKDKEGNMYIGDFGNNDNARKDLVIYKLPSPEKESGDKIDAKKIKFHYPEQKKFPPKKAKRFYDAEALFHHGKQLYIITKNRSNPFSGDALIYTVPDTKGEYTAKRIGTINLCDDWETCQITSIAISPDGKKIVALSYGKLFVFTDFTWDDFSKGKMTTIDLGLRTQLEAVCFTDNTTLLLSDEVSHLKGGNLYSYALK